MQLLENTSRVWLSLCQLALITGAACGGEDTDAIAPGEVIDLATFSSNEETGRPRLLAVGDGDVFWVDMSGALKRVAKTGGDAAELAVDTRIPMDLTASSDSVFWVVDGTMVGEPGAILRVPLDGGAATEVVQAEIRAVAADDERLYWTEGNENLDAAAGRVLAAAHDGGNATLLDQGSGDTGDLTVDGESVYWAAATFELSDRRDSIYRVAKSGGERAALAPVGGRVTFGTLEAFGDEVWFHDWNGNVVHLPSSGGSLETAAEGRWFEIASKGLVVLETDTSYRLVELAADGSRTVLVESESPIDLMAADESSVYWVEWKTVCVKEENVGKHNQCVESHHDGRIARVGL
jgi:hypothetical protein